MNLFYKKMVLKNDLKEYRRALLDTASRIRNSGMILTVKYKQANSSPYGNVQEGSAEAEEKERGKEGGQGQ